MQPIDFTWFAIQENHPIHIIGCIFEAEMFSDFMFLLLLISPFFVWVVVLQFAVKSASNTEIDTFMLWEK